MATQELTTLFEEVRTGVKGITSVNKKSAQENADWFYKKCKKNFPKKTDTEIETEAKHLINMLLGAKALLIQKINIKRNNVIVQNSKLKTGEKKMSVPSVEGSIGTYLIKKLIKYFNLIENPDSETEMSGYKRCLETLQKSFPHWEADGCQAVVAIFYLRYYSYLKTDKNAIIDRITKAYEISTKSKPVSAINPGYLITLAYQNKSLHELDNYSSDKIQATSLDDYPAFDELIIKFTDEIGDFDAKSSSDKLKDLWNWIKGFSSLTEAEKDLINTFIQEAMKEHSSYRDYTDACKKIFMEGDKKKTYVNFRTILSRIREEMRKDNNKAASGFMQFSRNFNWKFENIIKSLNLEDTKKTSTQDNMTNMDESEISDEDFTEGEEKGMLDELIINNSKINLKAYRFSAEETTKMQWLKKLFEDNGYYFNSNRFPEVYYDEFDRSAEIFPSLLEPQLDGTPDYLGVYLYNFEAEIENRACSKTKEGIIILFKDRIERSLNSTADSIRFVVLMHELGHWLTHWAYKDGKNWRIGYHLPNKNTHEALAQLIAFWASEVNPVHLDTLKYLTPKRANELDDTAIYGGYLKLINAPKVHILKKIHQLRKLWVLSDDTMFDFLQTESFKTPYLEINDFIIKKSKGPKLVDNDVLESIMTETECSDFYKENLDLAELIKLGLFKIESESINNFFN